MPLGLLSPPGLDFHSKPDDLYSTPAHDNATVNCCMTNKNCREIIPLNFFTQHPLLTQTVLGLLMSEIILGMMLLIIWLLGHWTVSLLIIFHDITALSN